MTTKTNDVELPAACGKVLANLLALLINAALFKWIAWDLGVQSVANVDNIPYWGAFGLLWGLQIIAATLAYPVLRGVKSLDLL